MAKVGTYCRAYPVRRLREFSGWSAAAGAAAGLADDDYLLVHENLVVTTGIFLDEGVVFSQTSPEWEAFCRDTLGFPGPDRR